mmetsp:Transcript_5673/g.10939  ORF Transcript_5673/g.10939 Transcript_5673/m.10939 type:complete len:93 (-) Transcript_5673:697-975(-)
MRLFAKRMGHVMLKWQVQFVRASMRASEQRQFLGQRAEEGLQAAQMEKFPFGHSNELHLLVSEERENLMPHLSEIYLAVSCRRLQRCRARPN